MKQDALQGAEKYTKARQRKKRWYRVVTGLACVVVFCTVYALILPAITMEKGACEIPEHTHSEACYTQVTSVTRTEPVCTIERLNLHQHDDTCYDSEGNLTCGYADFVVHRHDSACFDENGNLWCQLPEIEAHAHTESCYKTTRELTCGYTEEPAHKHTDGCYEQIKTLICEKPEIILHKHTSDCFDDVGNLICGKIQVLEHQHTDTCFETVGEPVDTETLTCTLPEDENHTHGPLCYGTWELTCGLEEHTHSPACGSDPSADLETAEIWEQTFAAVTLTGKWREDLIAIAETQLGYAESTKNYLVEDDGVSLKGYTRYGAWYGDPYGDWDAMFASFCLHYAGIADFPLSGDTGAWVAALGERFAPAGTYEPSPGELVFFDRDGDGTADHVGILVGITDSPEAAAGTFTTIEGDVADAVQTVTYSADEASVLGYGILPEQAGEFTLTAQTETGIVVTITGESASLPYPVGEITVTAAEVVDEESQAIRDQLLEEETVEAEQRFLLEITLWHDGEEIEPTGPVTVSFSGFDTEGLYPKVYHIDTEANEATDMDAVKDETGDITVSTDHFSLYDVQLLSAPEGTGISGESITQIANGGKYYLTGTAYTSNTITIKGDTTLDLNGYGVYYKGTGDFLVVDGGTLTIKDSNPASVSESGGSENLYGNAASLSFESNSNKPVKLTYYVTQSSASGTSTSETLKKYEVTPRGCIVGEAVGGAASIVKVNSGGTCNLEGGLLTIKNSSSYNGDAHIIFNSGTLNLRGGYVAGGKDACWGGGIFSKNGTVNMSGGVIAGNYGTNGGGLCVEAGSFTMTGGVISGNGTHSDNVTTGNWDKGLGGGVFAKNATVRIEGGYITNNSEYGKCEQNGFGCHGGGGIATTSGSLTMTGGYVTGNYSQESGGGIYVGHYNLGGTEFSMSGGIVAGNVAQQSEGGGIRVSGGTTGVINASGGKVYITNNCTNSTYDWGGGGIFVQEKGALNIYNSLITSNSAGGFGGGVGACPTGETLIVHKDGAAIYSNSASGSHMSGGGNGKNYDSTVANESTVFKSNGYQDYFCVRQKDSSSDISLVTGEMDGGGAANWQGSCDDSPITISKTGHAAAKYLFGLTAHPDSDAISSAQSVAGVVITGNSAYTHGGGIMTNGGLILGNTEGSIVTATPSLNISGTKTLLKDGAAQSSGLDYRFRLTNSSGEVVGTATADSSTGAFTISPNTEYEQTGTYTYYLTEVNDGRSGVTYDGSKYQIDVTIAEKSVTLMGVTFKSYYVDTVNVTKSGSGGSSSGGSSGGGSSGGGSETSNTFKIHYSKPSNWSNVYLHIWDGAGLAANTKWPGMPVKQNPNNSGWYTKEFTVSGSGTFKYIFNNGGDSKTDDCSGSYAPGTELWVNAKGSQTGKPNGWVGGGTSSEGTTTPSGEVILHFNNYDNWNEVALYIWNASGVNASGYGRDWPGGQVSADAAHSGWYTVSIPVTGTAGSFSFIFNNNKKDNGSKTGDLATGEISGGAELWITGSNTVLQAAPAEWTGGSTRSSDVSITTVKNPDESYSLTINGSAFTNTIRTSLNLQLTKTDSNDASKLLAGATFLLKQAGAENGTEATTDSNGIATFAGISRNSTYYLYEKTPPANYMTAGPWILEVGKSTATLYPATEGENGTLTKSSETGTELTVGGSDPIVLSATISDQSWGYELPDTGGAGTQLYTMGGLLLITSAAILLLYSHTRRRKEGSPSS